jgi:hypothetical protein
MQDSCFTRLVEASSSEINAATVLAFPPATGTLRIFASIMVSPRGDIAPRIFAFLPMSA